MIEYNYSSDIIDDNDKIKLRGIFGRFATGIMVATAINNENCPIGITINSFSSVSLEPPLIMFCVKKTSSSLNHFQNAKNYAINILSIEQKDISQNFAKHSANKFDNINWQMSKNNCPAINDTIGLIECVPYNIVEAGDHYILIGKVINAFINENIDPLIYYKGQYRTLK